ncbi:MAG: tetratricopeptide repeat protein [Synergistaceae bacterium]|nr:tetratricopeptide repeat protein [Synergistaceae bacterium]
MAPQLSRVEEEEEIEKEEIGKEEAAAIEAAKEGKREEPEESGEEGKGKEENKENEPEKENEEEEEKEEVIENGEIERAEIEDFERAEEEPPIAEPEQEPEPQEAKPRLALGTNDKPMPILWTHVVSMPDDWPEGEVEPPEARKGFFTQKLHDNLQGRKNLAVERLSGKGREPRCRLRAAVLCFLLLLALAVPSAALVWLQKQVRARPEGGPADPVTVAEAVPMAEPTPKPVALSAPPTESGQERTPTPEPRPTQPQLPVLSYEQRIKRGTEALRQGHYDAAAFSFAGALEMKGEGAAVDVRPWLGLAWAYRGKGMMFDAVRILDGAKEFFPHDPTIKTMRKTLVN